MSRGRVLVVGRGAPERGGIPTYLAMLAQAGPALGREMVLLNVADASRREGGATSWANLTKTFADVRRVLGAVRRGDIVHVHSAMAPAVTGVRAGLLLAAGRFRGAHTVLHAHGGRLPGTLTSGRRRRLARWSVAAADTVVTVSHTVLDALAACGVSTSRLELVANGVDVRTFAPGAGDPHDVPRVLFVGGLTPRKGVLDLLVASTGLRERGIEHEVWLAGGVPDEGDEAHAAVRAEEAAHVRFLGEVPHDALPALYASCDVFALPSWWEAMPLTVLEAMACGLPVVASSVGDIPVAVQDGRTGRVVPPHDVPALIAALASVLRDPDRAATWGEAGRERALLHYDEAATLQRLAEIYDALEEGR